MEFWRPAGRLMAEQGDFDSPIIAASGGPKSHTHYCRLTKAQKESCCSSASELMPSSMAKSAFLSTNISWCFDFPQVLLMMIPEKDPDLSSRLRLAACVLLPPRYILLYSLMPINGHHLLLFGALLSKITGMTWDCRLVCFRIRFSRAPCKESNNNNDNNNNEVIYNSSTFRS